MLYLFYSCLSFYTNNQFNDKIPQLEDMGIEQLYKSSELPSGADSQFKITELKKLLKSLLLNFLEVVGVMSVAPQEFASKVEHIRTVLINIHHLLNEYRPHQSRESLILLLENQVETKRKEIREMHKVCEEVEARVKRLVSVFVDGKADDQQDQETENDQREEGEVDTEANGAAELSNGNANPAELDVNGGLNGSKDVSITEI